MTKKKEVAEKEVNVKDEDVEDTVKSDKLAEPIQEHNKAWRVANGIQ